MGHKAVGLVCCVMHRKEPSALIENGFTLVFLIDSILHHWATALVNHYMMIRKWQSSLKNSQVGCVDWIIARLRERRIPLGCRLCKVFFNHQFDFLSACSVHRPQEHCFRINQFGLSWFRGHSHNTSLLSWLRGYSHHSCFFQVSTALGPGVSADAPSATVRHTVRSVPVRCLGSGVKSSAAGPCWTLMR